MVFAVVMLCGGLTATRMRLLEILGLLFLLYVAVSSLVSVSEITVVKEGLLVDRLLLPVRFVPWSAIDRVVVFSQGEEETGVELEIASIGIFEGLSPLNRLPGPMYGQGFRQTLIITPDALEGYDRLLETLRAHCHVFDRESRR
ncbi:MAG: hypothetical protein Kow00124_04920 [Anaerolineae bacterium]